MTTSPNNNLKQLTKYRQRIKTTGRGENDRRKHKINKQY